MVRPYNRPRPEELEGGGDPRHKDSRKVRAQGKLDAGTTRLVLTPYLRRKLKRPVGKVYKATELRKPRFLSALRLSPFVISVGDRVTESLQELGRTPDVQVIDETEMRARRPPPKVPFVRLVRASNPAGTITVDSIQAIQRALSGKTPARVMIDGEEDLLAIPAIEAAPIGSSVYYGQPGEGVVMVPVDKRAKSSAARVLAAMRHE